MNDDCEGIYLSFSMPYGGTLSIRSSKCIDELEVDLDEEIEDVTYRIYWNEKRLPWHTRKRSEAIAIATGCQWGAHEILK